MAAYALARFTSPNAGVSVNQAVTDQYIAAAYGLALKNLDVNAVGIAIANAFTAAGSLDLSAASDTAGLKLPSKAGAVPTADGFLAFDTTAHRPVVGENGSTLALSTVTGTETFTNKTLTSPVINVTSDATGDLYYRNSGGAFTRLAAGTNLKRLGLVAGIPSWNALTNGDCVYVYDFTGTLTATNSSSGTYVDFGGSFTTGAAVPVVTGDVLLVMVQCMCGKSTAGNASIVIDVDGAKYPGGTTTSSVIVPAGITGSSNIPVCLIARITGLTTATRTVKAQVYTDDTNQARAGAGNNAMFHVSVWR